VPGLPNYFSACGYAAGIVQAGVTRYVAEWIVEDEPGIDMAELDVRRFGVHANRAFTFSVVRAGHAFSNLPSYPYGERSSGRPARTSALHDRLDAARAVFGVRNGWEVPYWLAPAGAERKEKLGSGGQAGSSRWRRSAPCCRVWGPWTSYLSKFEVSGRRGGLAIAFVPHRR
jgi:dimethylglycine dehydrogenase